MKDFEGKDWWRSLEEYADSDAFLTWAESEFPQFADLLGTSINRRDLLKVMGSSLALAAMSGCSGSDDKRLVPYVEMPEQLVPGIARYFATTLQHQGYGMGVLAESHTGRPTKVEGNARHAASLGASSSAMQASVLELYDPQRSSAPLSRGAIASWSAFEAVMAEMRQQLRGTEANQDGKGAEGSRGKGLALLLPTLTSPTIRGQLRSLQKQLPELRWFTHDPVNQDNAIAGAMSAFGRPLYPLVDFSKAERVLSLDADFLGTGPQQLAATRQFMGARKVDDNKDDGEPSIAAGMNRLYVVEPTMSITGAAADHRWRMAGRDIEGFARKLLQKLRNPDQSSEDSIPRIDLLAEDLMAHAGRSVVLAGISQPAVVHHIVHALNEVLDNHDHTIDLIEPAESTDGEAFPALVKAMSGGEINTLLMLNVNPVYSAAVDLDFEKALQKVPQRIHLGLYLDETARLSHWHLPLAHDLESWGDLLAYDGTASLQQPLIAPLQGGRTVSELVGLLDSDRLNKGLTNDSWSLTRETWQERSKTDDFEQFWRQSLHDGVIADTRHAVVKGTTVVADIPPASDNSAEPDDIELLFRADPTIGDGRHSANAWLQELPKPLTRLTWDNVALVSTELAQSRDITNGQLLNIQHEGHSVDAPAWIMPGQARNSITLFLGYGRTQTAPLGVGIGYNAYQLRPSAEPWQVSGALVSVRQEYHELASTQHHHAMHGHDVLRTGLLENYLQQPALIATSGSSVDALAHNALPSLNPEPGPGADAADEQAYHWGMTIDLNACIGCGACVTACQAENNIPVVGKEEVSRGREMHWIRVDRYFSGEPEAPETGFQPVPCMHCEDAPCEYVCPVGATQHSPEGLNEMVYNRCIGTRYCSQNCPYKVRRFNWFDYTNDEGSPLTAPAPVHNPDVSVRVQGVMEKCTYCVQRINKSRIEAQIEDRSIEDGELVTACQQSCPSQAIAFGNLRDPESVVSRLKATPRNYDLLEESNTRPRTSYLAGIKNPLPNIHKISDDDPVT